jgi:MFS family permease
MRHHTRHETAKLVTVLGVTQTLAWASSTYLPAILATPIAHDLVLSRTTVFGAFSVALLVMAAVGPAVGKAVDRLGGRGVLMGSNLVLATGLLLLGSCSNAAGLYAAWVILGAGMALGLYDAAFSVLVRLYGTEARTPITGITLIGGFASTIGWPLTTFLDAELGWRTTCYVWATFHLLIGLPLNWRFIPRSRPGMSVSTPGQAAPRPAHPRVAAADHRKAVLLLAAFSAITAFVTSAMAAHLPGLLAATGAGAAAAVMASALLGPAQVAARFAEFAAANRFRLHPLVSARLATALHPVGAVLLIAFGGPMLVAALFAILHGAGNGMVTIAKGTLPLALFGPEGYGAQQGWLSMGARAMQAAAPYTFGLLLETLGGTAALTLSAALSVVALGTLMALPRPRH